jgi:ribonuclease G
MLKELLVSTNDRETRIAVLEDGRVAEVQVERRRQRGVVGNIYKGRVTRVLPGMQSAFVDVGLEKDAFLYVEDVGDEVDDFDRFGSTEDVRESGSEPNGGNGGISAAEIHEGEAPAKPILPSIDELLREGQELVVQVTKDQIAHKGVRITTHVTLPGRTLVYMPTIDHIGISRRIENEDERNRLKEILGSLKKGPGGFIVRTAGEGRAAEEFAADRR